MIDKISVLLNNLISDEFISAYKQLSYANFFDSKKLNRYANHYKRLAVQKINQAMKIYEYLHKNDQKIRLSDIVINYDEYIDVNDVLAKALYEEKQLSLNISNVFKECVEQKDYETIEFLKWLVVLQNKEENLANKLLENRNNCNDLYMLDNEYKNRRYNSTI